MHDAEPVRDRRPWFEAAPHRECSGHAAATCAAQYDGTSRHGNLFVTASANVTAGLM